MTLFPGTRLGPYELQAHRAVGRAEAYEPNDTPQHLGADPRPTARFPREAKIMRPGSHICTLHCIDRKGEVAFLVMEFVEGTRLARAFPS